MFQYRIYPTKKQLHKLNKTLEECRWLYNHLLERRKLLYEQAGTSLSLYQQQDTFGQLKHERPSLLSVHSQVLQNVAVRVYLAFKAFFRRVRAHAKERGYPRFKGPDRYDSFTFPQSGFSITHDERVVISKVGAIKMVYHRPMPGKIKTLTIHRSATGKWYACFSVECEPLRLPQRAEQVGIDVGLKTFATLSTGKPWQRCSASTPSWTGERLSDGSIGRWSRGCMNALPGGGGTSPTSKVDRSSIALASLPLRI